MAAFLRRSFVRASCHPKLYTPDSGRPKLYAHPAAENPEALDPNPHTLYPSRNASAVHTQGLLKVSGIANGADLVEGVSHEYHGSRAPPVVGEGVLHPVQPVQCLWACNVGMHSTDWTWCCGHVLWACNGADRWPGRPAPRPVRLVHAHTACPLSRECGRMPTFHANVATPSCTPSSHFSACGRAMWTCTQLTGRGVVGMYCGHALNWLDGVVGMQWRRSLLRASCTPSSQFGVCLHCMPAVECGCMPTSHANVATPRQAGCRASVSRSPSKSEDCNLELNAHPSHRSFNSSPLWMP